MVQEELTTDSIRRLKQSACYAFGNHCYRLSGIECSPIIGFSGNEREIEHMPESIIRLQQVDTCAGLSRQVYRRRNYHASVDSHSFGCFQGLETLACRLESHRTVTATTTPILIRNTHIVDMQKTVSGAKGATFTCCIITTNIMRKMASAVPAMLTALISGCCRSCAQA